ncbi:hypothetical protein GWI33_009952 [Rhynchophorus ferrugineus]|uniref:Uncharacterized protein n=1 Tax=Rhynchophorus ferrugineus TaxID=354439 RepID=A0A834IRF5_RHYFE|nr:hypothetical protein GWI33_009952 [Rhynchophorus ferrugineus]
MPPTKRRSRRTHRPLVTCFLLWLPTFPDILLAIVTRRSSLVRNKSPTAKQLKIFRSKWRPFKAYRAFLIAALFLRPSDLFMASYELMDDGTGLDVEREPLRDGHILAFFLFIPFDQLDRFSFEARHCFNIENRVRAQEDWSKRITVK